MFTCKGTDLETAYIVLMTQVLASEKEVVKKARVQRLGTKPPLVYDTNHKLIRWNLIIAGGIDGLSRLITFLKYLENNRADSLLLVFLEGVDSFGIPRVR